MPASADWRRVQTLEDLMATLVAIDDLAECVQAHAWRQGDWQTVFRCARDILANTAVLRREMAARWDSLVNEARK